MEDFIKDLETEHEREFKTYTEKPELYKDYNKEKGLFINKQIDNSMVRNQRINQHDLERRWKMFWPVRLREIFDKKLEEKKSYCIDFVSRKNSDTSPHLQEPNRNESNSKKFGKSDYDSFDIDNQDTYDFNNSNINQSGTKSNEALDVLEIFRILKSLKEILVGEAKRIEEAYYALVKVKSGHKLTYFINEMNENQLLKDIKDRLEKYQAKTTSVVQSALVSEVLNKVDALLERFPSRSEIENEVKKDSENLKNQSSSKLVSYPVNYSTAYPLLQNTEKRNGYDYKKEKELFTPILSKNDPKIDVPNRHKQSVPFRDSASSSSGVGKRVTEHRGFSRNPPKISKTESSNSKNYSAVPPPIL